METKPKSFRSNAKEVKLPISAFLITKNEEKNIRACLESLAFCNEIIVVDSGSSDLTCRIAEEMGARVLYREFSGYTEQKQFALDMCSNDWVLSLDADERVPLNFYNFLDKGDYLSSSINGYELKRLHRFLGSWVKHSGLYPDYKLRFFKRSKGKFVGNKVHEVIELEGESTKLPFDLIHYSWIDLRDFFSKQFSYADRVAQNKYEGGLSVTPIGIILKTVFTFFYRYFIRKGYLDGAAGFILCLSFAVVTAYKYLRLYEKNHSVTKVKYPFLYNLRGLPFSNLLTYPSSFLYKVISDTRYFAFKKGLFNCETKSLPIPVISIGNLSLGGTGKTTFTIWLTEQLSKENIQDIVILTRGYGGQLKSVPHNVSVQDKAEDCGDEPLMMKLKLKDKASIVVDANRVRGGNFAVRNLHSKVALLDDGFQHIQLKRDFDICLLDCADEKSLKVFPLGNLREDFNALQRANCVILTRTKTNPNLTKKLIAKILNLNAEIEIYELTEKINKFTLGLSPIEEFTLSKKAIAFCGLGNPKQFFDALEKTKFNLVEKISFPDHYKYNSYDLNYLIQAKEAAEAECIITTFKDAVKLNLTEHPELAQNLIVAHVEITELKRYKDGLTIDLRYLLGSDIFRKISSKEAEKID
jgi:tetraacyldisaccharide 4'-kinase